VTGFYGGCNGGLVFLQFPIVKDEIGEVLDRDFVESLYRLFYDGGREVKVS
jgi:hypothetical protein